MRTSEGSPWPLRRFERYFPSSDALAIYEEITGSDEVTVTKDGKVRTLILP